MALTPFYDAFLCRIRDGQSTDGGGPGSGIHRFSFTAGRNRTVSNQYIDSTGGVPTNLTPYVLLVDMELYGISAATRVAETWTAEVRINGSLTPIASLSISAADKAYDAGFSVLLSAGDCLQMYCNGTSISRPSMTVYLKER